MFVVKNTYIYDYLNSNNITTNGYNNTDDLLRNVRNDSVIMLDKDIQDKITEYSLERKQMIPKVEVKDYPKQKNVYINDVIERTSGELYLGVVGSVRSGKSTFIRRAFGGFDG